MENLRKLKASELIKVAEVVDRNGFVDKIITKAGSLSSSTLLQFENKLSQLKIPQSDLKTAFTGSLLTYLLHCEARVASYLGQGFYTIGPCGEELLGVLPLAMQPQDITALHYRHLATSIVRQLIYEKRSIEDIALDRARGYTCSINDPVTGGRHCSIGGHDPNGRHKEFLVTSTLSSQVPAAVGRALSIPLSQHLLPPEKQLFNPKAISLVSVGDGSVNNAHFLSGLNLARYAQHNNIKCPSVFVVSDNNICISLKGTGYVTQFVEHLSKTIFTQVADGKDALDLYEKGKLVCDFARANKKPSFLLIKNLPRRFGHAATDRQFAYYTAEEIADKIQQDPLSDNFAKLLATGFYTKDEIEGLFHNLSSIVEKGFNQAASEPKISSRTELIHSNSVPVPAAAAAATETAPQANGQEHSRPTKDVMRKHMTRIFDELLSRDKSVVYIGEDVQHGGYYVVTEGLHRQYPQQVRDFPPDETSLMGAAIGFAQSGLTPILEIPYAKYLDCASDMFYEAIIQNWLSNGRQRNGMVIRLQGFDKGIFGGNFHTHNMLAFPPGLDVVCFSNGGDYVRGMRYAVACAKAGRVVMSVDSTDLLNRRHLVDAEKDELFLKLGETHSQLAYDFDEISVFENATAVPVKMSSSNANANANGNAVVIAKPQVVVVTYGNGLPTALLAKKAFNAKEHNPLEMVVIDSPSLSQTPKQLAEYFRLNHSHIKQVIFADVCKYGPGMPLAARALDLQNMKLLQNCDWRVIGAAPTYNPLGTYLTFLSTADILTAVDSMTQER